MATPVKILRGETITLVLPDLPAIEVSLDPDDYALGTWVVFKCCGFETIDAAQTTGQRFGDALSIIGVIDRLGIDLGLSRSTLQFSDAIHEAVRRESGRAIRSNAHGLMTFDEGSVVIFGVNAHGTTSVSNEHFRERVAEWFIARPNLTDRQRNCAALINDSFFVPNTEGQFILRISAVEALCDESEVGSEYKDVIQSLENHLTSLSADEVTRKTVAQLLNRGKQKSLRQSYMGRFRGLLSDEEARSFDRIYGLRSKLLHEGIGRGALTEAANEALDLAVALYEAELCSNRV